MKEPQERKGLCSAILEIEEMSITYERNLVGGHLKPMASLGNKWKKDIAWGE